MENYAIMPSLEGIDSKGRNFEDFPRAKKSEKPFLTAVEKPDS
jgi:hypothetical protein